MNELNAILEYAIRKNATDIHFHASSLPRARINNELIPFTEVEPLMENCDAEKIFSQILEALEPSESTRIKKIFDADNDIDCAFTCASGSRVRANVYRFEKGLGISLRIIPRTPISAEKIGVPPATLEMIRNKSGLILVTGANGSGKSTTLAAFIDRINNTRNAHILTIEDPIEYLMESKKCLITQREIGRHSQNFYSALRSSMRENPDVIMLGEMRDLETTRIALELAETGHLVFATLHTRSAALSIDRLIGQFPGAEQGQIKHMLAGCLLGIISQNLLAKIGGGLVASFELLISNSAIKNLIREQNTSQILSSMQTGAKQGMIIMENSLMELIERGIVAPEEAVSKALDPANFAEKVMRNARIDSHKLQAIYSRYQ